MDVSLLPFYGRQRHNDHESPGSGRGPDRYRRISGDVLATGCAAALAILLLATVRMLRLGLLGVGLGTYTPANNTAIMATVPPQQAAAAGGMVNMARGLGTALGVALLTLALHAAARRDHGAAGAGGGFPQAGNR